MTLSRTLSARASSQARDPIFDWAIIFARMVLGLQRLEQHFAMLDGDDDT